MGPFSSPLILIGTPLGLLLFITRRQRLFGIAPVGADIWLLAVTLAH